MPHKRSSARRNIAVSKNKGLRRAKCCCQITGNGNRIARHSTMLLGYARVSKADDQDTAAQTGTLKAAGCARVFEERASGGRWDRPELQRLLDQLREGDAVVVWKLDRLSRSLKDLLHILEKIDAVGASFRSLTEAIDTSGPAGRMMMQMLGCFAEFERAMVRERTRAGLTAARARGRTGGRRPKLLAQQRTEILGMLAAGRTGADVARIFRVHRATISRIVAEARTMATDATPPPQDRTRTEPAPAQNHRRPGRRTAAKS
jgi:DNA invertase Pin-like site-specific DNA recombinase